MPEEDRAQCRKVSWWTAIAAGLLVMLMLWQVAKTALLMSLLIGAVLAAALGFFLVWAFCAKAAEARPAEAPAPAPAPEAAPPAAVGPSPILVPQPEAAAAGAVAAVATPVEPMPAKARAPSRPRTATAKKAAPVSGAPAKPAPARKAAAGLDAALAKSKDAPASGAPELLDAPRGGKADDLKMIRGVGPKLEELLNSVGVWHFDQIASWKARNIAFVDERMEGFKGRITRDEWVKQAKVLARGGRTEFSERVRKGGVYRSMNEGA